MPTLTLRGIASLGTLLVSSLALSGCGGGGGSGSGTGSGTSADLSTSSVSPQGSVAVFVTDAPADPDLFSAINARLKGIELLPEDAVEPVVLRDGPATTVDLMNRQRDAIPISYGEGVPEGRYCRIRLHVESVELVLTAGGSVYPELPAGGRLELIPKTCIDVAPDQVVHVQLDLDVGKSVYWENSQYHLRPVFYVDIIHGDVKSRLVRLEGEIAESDPVNDRLLLCDTVPVYRHDHETPHLGCAWVDISDDTGFFDNIRYSGQPRPLSELFLDDALGEPTTIVGVVERFSHGYLDLDIPAGHRPPPGECKLWYPKREAGQQPPPASCVELIATAPPDVVVIDHDGRIVLDRRGLMTLTAVAVELGDFLQVDGSVASGVVGDTFTMDVAAGEPVDSADPLPVRLQEAPAGGNGTRIVSKTGTLLTATDIDAGESISVDSVLVTSAIDSAYLRSALIVLDDTFVGLERLSGTVMTVGASSATVATFSAEDNPCADAAGDVLVELDIRTSFLTVTVTATDSTTAMGGELEPGQEVDIYGKCELTGSFDALQVVIIDDQRVL